MTTSSDQKPPSPGPERGTCPVQPAAVRAGIAPRAGELVTVTLPGEIDFVNAGEVRDALAEAMDSGAAVVIADAAGTTFCDCAGARELVRAHHRAARAGTALRVAAATSSAVRRVLDLTGAGQVLDTYPTLAAARADLRAACPRSRPPGPEGAA